MNKLLTLMMITIFLAGCTTTPQLSDYQNDPNGMWEQGKKSSDKGEKLVVKGEKLLDKSRQEANDGEKLIQRGTDTILVTRQDYQLEIANIGGSTTPKEVMFEAKRLTSIGNKWEDAIDDVKKGNTMVVKAKKKQVEAKRIIQDGKKLVESGSNFIRNSQRMRLQVPLVDSPETK